MVIGRWLVALVYAAFIFMFSRSLHSSASSMSYQLAGWFPFLAQTVLSALVFYLRKMLHITGYFVGTGIIYYAVKVTPGLKKAASISTLVLITALAIGDEWYQSTLPHRTGKMGDVFIDLIGIAIGLLVLQGKKRKASALN